MSDLLSIGASGVSSYQTALATVSENIANVGTAGYSRRTATLAEVGSTGTGLSVGTIRQGNGVTVSGIARSGDTLKQAAVRSAGADLARTQGGSVWLDRIQSVLTGNDLSERMTSFFSAATTLAADPTSTTSRNAMLEAGSAVAAGFTATGRAFDQAFVDLDASADQATTQVDSLAAALAKVNDGLGRTQPGTGAAAQLADQRDTILESLSALVDTSVTTDPLGRATVKVGAGSGATLVSGADAGSITYVRGTDGSVSYALHRAGTVSAVAPQGGLLAGLADGASRLADAAAAVDTLAGNFAAAVNTTQAGGQDLDGKAGAAMFTVGTPPTEMTLALTDPRGIAAATTGSGTRDAGNLQVLQAARTTGGFESGLSTLVSANATAIAGRKTIADAQGAIRDGAVTARDAVSGVNMDTEAVDLLRFQQAYQASSRVIQVAREIFQSILAIN